MSKRGLEFALLIIIGVILVSGFAIGADANTTAAKGDSSKAYSCLQTKVESSAGLALQDAIFASLAIGANAKIDGVIQNEKSANDECWPNAGCKVKETAQMALVYQRLGKGATGIKSYLDTRIGKATGINWYLQIDVPSRQSSKCTITTGDSSKVVTITEEQTITGTLGTCFTLGGNGFWLQVKESCFNKDISINCDKDFVTSLVYQRTTSNVVFIAGEAHSQAASGTTGEKVVSQCFLTNAKCDYEGSLWAALAYKKLGADISGFMPYLLALSEDNLKYFPNTFLYMITAGDGYYSDIVQRQKDGKYWEIAGSLGKFYDTALAIMALSSSSASEAGASKDYLLSIQGKDGCWSNMNLRDSAFILYAGWPKSVAGGKQSCLEAKYSCEVTSDCEAATGKVLPDYDCAQFGRFCCSVKVPLKSCTELQGKTCAASEQCTGTSVESSDGSCCVGTCAPATALNICEQQYGGVCKSACASGEESTTYSCGTDATKSCCITVESSGLGWIAWMFIFGILIIIVVLGIVYREKVKVWWLMLKGKLITSPIFKKFTGKGGEPAGFMQRAPPRYPPSGQNYSRPMMPARPSPQRSSDVEETLRKLREMTK